jgi:hypothetical protein
MATTTITTTNGKRKFFDLPIAAPIITIVFL